MSSNELIPIEKVDAIEVFTGGGLDDLLSKIKSAATSGDLTDVSTEKSRKEIASQAYAVSRSKTAIDNAGKELVSEWKEKSKKVDAARKKARDFLDDLRDQIRAPLNEWEEEQARKQREIEEAAERARQEAERKRLEEIEAREAEIRRREAAIRAAEEEAQRKADQERLEAERIEREKRIAAEAAAKAEREKEAAIRAAEEAARRAEEEKARAIKEAEERARLEAIRQREAEEAELARIRADQEKLEREQKHRAAVASEITSSLIEHGVDKSVAETIVTLIAAGRVTRLSIDYSILREAA